ncbi:MAG TPA: alpha-amylase family glycosyl hydrolase, partial [Cyclobacteriaceae bacterium]|nr:alpha-amylase family glycosyl hydrolase [Cyclobacteriaceae bacterium]
NGQEYFSSPAAWEDEVFYFLLLDRFSDGKEYSGFFDVKGKSVTKNKPIAREKPVAKEKRSTPLFSYPQDARTANRDDWFKNGQNWCGGTLAGLRDKLGYLKRLGITVIWISPIFKQVTASNSYHGYGIQNFLDVDPHFGTRDELKVLVREAHDVGIRVVLDIILNHAGDVFAYKNNDRYYYFNGEVWPIRGFRKTIEDHGSLPFDTLDADAWPDAGVWPSEFQKQEVWTRQGEIRNWDGFPEYIDGDFLALKDINHGVESAAAPEWDLRLRIDQFKQSSTLRYLGDVYKFWIAFADIDGYRIDTVKHMEPGAVRYFTNVIHEFAQSIGKEDFYLIGEVTGGRAHAVDIVEMTGLDAALGIDDIQDQLEFLTKGWRNPGNPQTPAQEGYFDLFRNSILDDKSTHQWYGKHVVVMFDDHDQVGVQHKFRFCDDGSNNYQFLRPALGLNLTTLGIPCIYYGTEQGFNGKDWRIGDDTSYSDVFLRECMFGGPFGSFQSTGRHFFNENHEIFKFIQELTALRKKHEHITLRRGRQYLRQISLTGQDNEFFYPEAIGGELRSVIAWSRIFSEQEYVCAINTDYSKPLTVWVVVDSETQKIGSKMTCLLSTDAAQRNTTSLIEAKKGKAVKITVPPAG